MCFLRLYVPRIVVARVTPLNLESASEVVLRIRNPVHSYVDITVTKGESSSAEVEKCGYIHIDPCRSSWIRCQRFWRQKIMMMRTLILLTKRKKRWMILKSFKSVKEIRFTLK